MERPWKGRERRELEGLIIEAKEKSCRLARRAGGAGRLSGREGRLGGAERLGSK